MTTCVGEAKIGSLGINIALEVHVGWIPSNLTDSIHLGLTLQAFETSGGGLQIFILWG
jgi:hypothetical protein